MAWSPAADFDQLAPPVVVRYTPQLPTPTRTSPGAAPGAMQLMSAVTLTAPAIPVEISIQDAPPSVEAITRASNAPTYTAPAAPTATRFAAVRKLKGVRAHEAPPFVDLNTWNWPAA